MSHEMFQELLVFVGIVTAMGCFTSIAHGLLKRWRSKSGDIGRDVQGALTDIAQRLARLEQSSDAMSVEIERISEGQRFTTKLLVERGKAAGQVEAGKKVITPH